MLQPATSAVTLLSHTPAPGGSGGRITPCRKIVIARAYLREARSLILDEPTAALCELQTAGYR